MQGGACKPGRSPFTRERIVGSWKIAETRTSDRLPAGGSGAAPWSAACRNWWRTPFRTASGKSSGMPSAPAGRSHRRRWRHRGRSPPSAPARSDLEKQRPGFPGLIVRPLLAYYAALDASFLRVKPRPASPRPARAREAGSGTVLATALVLTTTLSSPKPSSLQL